MLLQLRDTPLGTVHWMLTIVAYVTRHSDQPYQVRGQLYSESTLRGQLCWGTVSPLPHYMQQSLSAHRADS